MIVIMGFQFLRWSMSVVVGLQTVMRMLVAMFVAAVVMGVGMGMLMDMPVSMDMAVLMRMRQFPMVMFMGMAVGMLMIMKMFMLVLVGHNDLTCSVNAAGYCWLPGLAPPDRDSVLWRNGHTVSDSARPVRNPAWWQWSADAAR